MANDDDPRSSDELWRAQLMMSMQRECKVVEGPCPLSKGYRGGSCAGGATNAEFRPMQRRQVTLAPCVPWQMSGSGRRPCHERDASKATFPHQRSLRRDRAACATSAGVAGTAAHEDGMPTSALPSPCGPASRP